MPPQDTPSPGRFHALLDRSAAAWLILAIGLAVTTWAVSAKLTQKRRRKSPIMALWSWAA